MAIKPKTTDKAPKYVRLAIDASADDRKVIWDKIQKGELKEAYFAVDGDKAYHYYEVLK
jgi:hypothetical protein